MIDRRPSSTEPAGGAPPSGAAAKDPGPAPARRPGARASLAVALSSIAWGLFWLPLREMEGLGVGGGWATLGFFSAALPVILPLAWLRRRELAEGGASLAITSAVTGLAFLCYALSLLMTEVVRALLLFYVTPLWGTLLAWLLLGERMTRARMAALLLAFGGLLTIFGLPRETVSETGLLGDLLGLASGLLWAYGTLRIYRWPERGGATLQAFGFFFWAALFSLPALLLLPAVAVGPPPTAEAALAVAPFAIGAATLVYLPSMALIFWGATHLDPGRVGLLMLGEVVVGVGSAALLTEEPFGLREALGTGLILAAAVVEVLGSRPSRPA